MSPFRNPTWEFIMTPIIMLTAGLALLISWLAPVGYLVEFQVRALSEEELWEWEDDDED